MVDPSWFYSTLAQSTAAVIGFVLAMSSSLHSSRQARKRRRVADFREEFQDWRGEFFPIIQEISRDMAFNTDIPAMEFKWSEHRVDDCEQTLKNLEDWSTNQEDSYMALCWAICGWIQQVGRDLDSTSDIEEMQEYLNELDRSTVELDALLPISGNPLIFFDIAGTSESEFKPDSQIFRRSGPIQSFLRNELYHLEPEGSFASRALVAEELSLRLHKIASQNYLSDPDLKGEVLTPLLRRGFLLFLSGVILPLAFLLYIPDSVTLELFPPIVVPIIEILVLSIVTIQSWYFFKEFQNLDGEPGY